MVFKISINSLNNVFLGGLREGVAIHLYGPPRAGKSILCFQLACELIAKNAGNALYVDTEASFLNTLQIKWINAFKKRFNVNFNVKKVSVLKYARKRKDKRELIKVFETVLDDLGIKYSKFDLENAVSIFLKKIEVKSEKGENMIYVLEENDVMKLLALLGVDAVVDCSGEKMEFKVKGLIDSEASPLSKFISEYNVKVIVLDSIGMLLKRLRSDLSSLPARAQILNHLLGSLLAITSKYSLILLITNHESKAPQGFYSHHFGGASIGYGFKYSFYLCGHGDTRKLILIRSPYHKDRSMEIPLKIVDSGFIEEEALK